MSKTFDSVRYPELVIGIAGPIGIDIDGVGTAIADALKSVGYRSTGIRITAEIASYRTAVKKPRKTDFYHTMLYKMAHASAVCEKHKDPAILMRIAIDAIRRERKRFLKVDQREIVHLPLAAPGKLVAETPEYEPIPSRAAYIIRQVKRPEEVELLREVYGRQFVLISAYGSESDRRGILEDALKRSMPIGTSPVEVRNFAEDLIFRDADEEGNQFGQHLRDTFPLADVFVDGIAKTAMNAKVARFVNALFGLNEIAPTKSEYGMYTAKSASLRSSDLARQVGAAIFSDDGLLLTQGCNEVPRAFGGTYWDGEEPDFRDIKIGYDPNDVLKRETVRDLLERLSSAGLLSPAARSAGASTEFVNGLFRVQSINNQGLGAGCLKGSYVAELTEYGRVVHAEMGAICDAARAGVSLRGAVLFCTTFPCHNCTKHIISAGIKKVIYMEPYPKSKVKELHKNEVEIEKPSTSKVSFMPFLGISPQRYRDIFQKKSRKTNGHANKWYRGEPRPMVDVLAPTYTELEQFAVANLWSVYSSQ
jgi:deoxycytidylate deaminase